MLLLTTSNTEHIPTSPSTQQIFFHSVRICHRVHLRAAGPSSSYDRRDWSQRGGNRPQTRGKDWVGPKRYENADEDGTPFRGGEENEFAYGGF